MTGRHPVRTGTTEAYVARKRKARWRALPHLAVYGSYCVAKGLGLLLLASLRGRAAAARALQLSGYGAGQLAGALGLRYAEYRRVDGD